MAGELLVIIANRPSLGASLQYARELNDAPALLAYMIVILTIGSLWTSPSAKRIAPCVAIVG